MVEAMESFVIPRRFASFEERAGDVIEKDDTELEINEFESGDSSLQYSPLSSISAIESSLTAWFTSLESTPRLFSLSSSSVKLELLLREYYHHRAFFDLL